MSFVVLSFEVISKYLLQNHKVMKTQLYFVCKIFTVLALTLRLIDVFWASISLVWDICPSLLFYIWKSSFPGITSWRDYSFPIEWTWHLYQKGIHQIHAGLCLDWLLFHLSVCLISHVPKSHRCHFFSFVICFGNLILFKNIIFCYLWPHINFRITLLFLKNKGTILIGIT